MHIQKPKQLSHTDQRGFTHLLIILLLIVAFAITGTYLLVRSHASPLPATACPTGHTCFIDISSPQCNSLATIGHQDFGIVGLNGTKLDFETNPCLSQELSLFNNYSLYVGSNYPSNKCPSTISPYQCGQLAGQYDVQAIANAKITKKNEIWIDVEGLPGSGDIPWSKNPVENQGFLLGMYTQLTNAGYPVGFYSNSGYWSAVTSNTKHTMANWYPIGPGTVTQALNNCTSNTFAGAKNIFIQYVENNIDHNVSCSSPSSATQQWAAQIVTCSHITYDNSSSGLQAAQQLRDLASGIDLGNCGKTVPPSILVYLLGLSQNHTINISNFIDLPPAATCSSPHANECAVDINMYDGKHTNGTDSVAKTIVGQALQLLGGHQPLGFGTGAYPLNVPPENFGHDANVTYFADAPNHVHTDLRCF